MVLLLWSCEGCLKPRVALGHLSQAARDDITLCDEDCAHGGEEKGRPLAEHGNYGDESFASLAVEVCLGARGFPASARGLRSAESCRGHPRQRVPQHQYWGIRRRDPQPPPYLYVPKRVLKRVLPSGARCGMVRPVLLPPVRHSLIDSALDDGGRIDLRAGIIILGVVGSVVGLVVFSHGSFLSASSGGSSGFAPGH